MEIKNITKAIIEVMKEVNNVEKNTTVGNGNNSYKAVSDKDVKKTVRESMSKNGLSLVPTGVQSKIQIDRWEEEATWNGKTQIKTKQSVFTEVETKYLLLHTSGESIELSGYGQGVDTQDKGAGKATTYALKNVLIGLFLIPTGDDTDNTHSDNLPVPQKKSYNNKNKWYNDTAKHIDVWRDKVADGTTTGKAILGKIIADGFSINSNDKELILNLDK